MLSFRDYLEFAEKQIVIAEDREKSGLDAMFALIPAFILAWSAMESFVNNRMNDFATLPESVLGLHERAFLLEKKIKFVNSGEMLGKFTLEGNDFSPLEAKIFFLLAKFGGDASANINKGDTLWQRFERFKDVRDALVHPKQERQYAISVSSARESIETAKEVIHLISENIWGKKVGF